jgi:hypothetical protein
MKQATKDAKELIAQIRAYTKRAPLKHFLLEDEEAALLIDDLVQRVAKASFEHGQRVGYREVEMPDA